MLGNLTNKFISIFDKLRGKVITQEHLDSSLRELRIALIEADVALPVVKEFISNITQVAKGQQVIKSVTPSQMIIKIVHDELVKTLSHNEYSHDLKILPASLNKIMLLGMQGSGKTTSISKIAFYLKNLGKKVLLCSVDVYRPAAIDQLKILASSINIDFYSSPNKQGSPVEILKSGIKMAEDGLYDVFLCDTAGRLHIDTKMMAELKELHKLLNPQESLLVVDVLTGQDSTKIIKSFHEAVDITGVVLTRTDSDAKGGIALSIKYMIQRPIKFLGNSEKIDGLEKFNPDQFASRLLDMGDIVGLVEKAKEKLRDISNKDMEKITKGKFSLESYLTAMSQMNKLGSLSSLINLIPGSKKLMNNNSEAFGGLEKSLKKQKSIILSMTKKERKNPEILNGPRKRRIAAGSGTSVQEINILLKQFNQMSKMMSSFNKNPKSMLGNLFKMLK